MNPFGVRRVIITMCHPNRSMLVRVPGAVLLASMKLAVGQSSSTSTLAKGHAQHSQRATPLVLCHATRTLWPKAKLIHLIVPRIAISNASLREGVARIGGVEIEVRRRWVHNQVAVHVGIDLERSKGRRP